MIPIIDLQEFQCNPEFKENKLLAERLVNAFHDIGFIYLINHGVSNNAVESAFSASKHFFERPITNKIKFHRKNATEGYHGAYGAQDEIKTENGNLTKIKETKFDFRESFDFFGDINFETVSPDPIDQEFCKSMKNLQEACRQLCVNLLKLLGIGLELDDEDYFENCSLWLQQNSNVQSFKTFRALYYPSIPDEIEIPVGKARVKEHSDHGFLTLLFQDDVGGLEVQDRQGQWLPAEPIPGSIVVNIGDLLEFWSGGFLRATKHRVLIPEQEIQRRVSRQSIVFFLHPDAEISLTPFISSMLKPYHLKTITAGEFAAAKLAAVRSY